MNITVDGTIFMPATDQSKKVGSARYEYRVPQTLAAGAHTIKVFWADDKTHTPAGAPQTVTCTVLG